MKKLFLFLFCVSVGCHEPIKPAAPVANTPRPTHSIKPTKEEISIDSFLLYWGKEMDFHSDYNLAAAKYYTTEKEKYRLQANRFRDSSHKYFLLLEAYNKKIKTSE